MVGAPRRGEVWWADLQSPRRSQPGFPRPVLVVQSNSFNKSAIGTMIVALITSNVRLADAPGNTRLRPVESGLPRVSVVNVSQLFTVSREVLRDKAGTLPANTMNRVAQGLRQVLAL